MKIYKFGGASVKDAEGIRNLTNIVLEEKDNLVVVVSALGKTTNALEKVLKTWLEGEGGHIENLNEVYLVHLSIIRDLFPDDKNILRLFDDSFARLREFFSLGKRSNYDFEYDQVVSYGEIWSSIIVAEYLKSCIPHIRWVDIRETLITDDRFRDANILWSESTRKVLSVFNFTRERIYVTQGFIGGTISGFTTTLGREGSDFTAAILANILDAESVVVWKDVQGMMNADPKWLPDALKLDEISYREAVEMTFSGAKVIHPKTIKPLHNKNIPLYVRSFLDRGNSGTVIKSDAELKKLLPLFIKKEEQILISILPKDFSFVMGDNLSQVFQSFMLNKIKVNLVQASAVSINVCIDNERPKVEALLDDLKTEFSTVYNENVELLSIRHYTPEAVSRITDGREILLEQRTRSTVRFVVRQ